MAEADTFDIAGQQANEADARAKAKLKQKLELDDLQWLMRDKRGRRLMYRQLEAAGVFRISFNTNALQMAFNEGNRNQGLLVTAQLLQHCHEHYTQMLKEHSENE